MTSNRRLVDKVSKAEAGQTSVQAFEPPVLGHGCLDGSPRCPKCGCYDLAPVDSIPGKPVVACNRCDHFFDPRDGQPG